MPCASDQSFVTQNSHNALLDFDQFARVVHRTQGNPYIYWFIIKDITKDTNEYQLKR
jgi:hypothetical protein